MNIDIIGNGDHVEITSSLRTMVEHKLQHSVINKLNNVTHIKIILKVDKNEQLAEGVVHYGHNEIFADAVSEDMYKSIDILIHRLEKQALKLKDKMKDHGHGCCGHHGSEVIDEN